jgi:hypothetical protein
MRRTRLHSQIASLAELSAPLIAVGLTILIAAVWIPALPVVTAMALLALGATNATLRRFRRSPTLVPALVLHATTYVGLYALCIGATLHAATNPSAQGLGASETLDLAASTLPMAVALQRIGAMFARLGGAP